MAKSDSKNKTTKAMPQRFGVAVVGSLNMDLVVRTETMPVPGQTVMGQNFLQMPGGKGANQAAAAGILSKPAGKAKSRLGAASRIVGRVGGDVFGKLLLQSLVQANVDTTCVIKTAGSPSGTALIVVDRHGENAIVVAGGANERLTTTDLLAKRKSIESAVVVLIQLEIPFDSVACAIALAKRGGAITILDPAPAPPDGIPESLYHVDILTPNQSEARILTGIAVRTPDDARRAGEIILARGTSTVIVKLGAAGAAIVSHNPDGTTFFKHIVGFKVPVVDTTAAGDCFNGALSAALAEGRELPAAVRFANAAGALACTKVGAQSAIPTRAEVEALLAR